LITQRQGVTHNLVTDREHRHIWPDLGHRARGLHAEGHRRPRAHIPAASANDVVPIAHASGLDREQHLAETWLSRVGELERFDLSTD
jgi:hypothetical protein